MSRPRNRPTNEPRTRLAAPIDYRALAEFRHQLRRYSTFTEHVARAAGVEPQHHQLLIALKGLPSEQRPVVGALAERLQLKHHTVVGLLDRMVSQGWIRRRKSVVDRREIIVELTASGERLLSRLGESHHAELESVGPALVRVLDGIVPPSRTALTARRRRK